MISLILGGIKSGKTRLAERLASESDKAVVVIATAAIEHSANDPEMAARIQKHKTSRPQHWKVIEEPISISDVIRGCTNSDIVIVDCLTLWLTNLLMQNDDELLSRQRKQLLNTLQSNSTDVILVSNETNMGIIPMGELTRRFCDEAGTLHQQLADVSDQVTLCVAGLPHLLKSNSHQGHKTNGQQTTMTRSNDDSTTPAEKNNSAEHKARMQKMQQQQKEKVAKADIERGILIVNTGDGKGKSSSAFGTAIRAAGHGQKVGIMQFIKGTWKTGEAESFKRFPEIEHLVSGDGFTWNTQDLDEDTASARHGWQKTIDMIERCRGENPDYDLIVLDELNIALRYDYLDIREVVSVLQNKPEKLNIIVTGRDAKPELIDIADTVTDMTMVKHAFEAGIRAQKGVEF